MVMGKILLILNGLNREQVTGKRLQGIVQVKNYGFYSCLLAVTPRNGNRKERKTNTDSPLT
jgi:hypothetical protein